MAENEEQAKDKCCREKYWDELDADGKIERLRQIIKNQQNIITGLDNIVSALREHVHADGEIKVSLDNGIRRGEGRSAWWMRDKYI